MAHQTVGHARLEAAAPPKPGLPDDPHIHVPEPTPTCPVEITLAVLRGRWTTLVIRELLKGGRTYTQLREALPTLSDKVLSDRLAHLAEANVVTRHRTPAWPPTTHYELTPQGQALGPVLQALWTWSTTPHPH
ncbi:winged helix-turn-helix transcriptional regulator [Actinomadura rupiterrae]|uniref:winged helix-turn-helix transcriptional regulator n=1 Tax=Actinomadura rupiterrae TaxID=559627 RepID=UPI0020A39461|nr:helix-turn-helix domain-containing protein [Actinomadura rupiterrae]MCP2340021.1 DNA-binding HxlR family transcriptional regulator [Actinomadura rupiterrae]